MAGLMCFNPDSRKLSDCHEPVMQTRCHTNTTNTLQRFPLTHTVTHGCLAAARGPQGPSTQFV